MGIYEFSKESRHIQWANGGQTWWELSDPGYGQKRRRLIVAQPWSLDPRTTCYCCSCPEGLGRDVDCRNHGFDGVRPCETHGMAGEPGDDGAVPVSVEAKRRANEQARGR